MNQLIISLLVSWVRKFPANGYMTYVTNIGVALLWLVLAALTGHYELAAGFIGQAMSNMFARRATESNNAKLLYLEGLLQDLSTQLAVQYPTGPEADTRVRDSQ